ncbi:sensor domain-containing diguanylate cyclase [Algibacillus agarilyticus]|uniref:sensor domain-containing diguanylate cyclase n=1 Tax=Algibacillus agarilyticus TaxID=2234133 RepID=UPI000DD0122A|nr:sensor domain-containing diguanylate cyclase [Algibacillus agarilyticus]
MKKYRLISFSISLASIILLLAFGFMINSNSVEVDKAWKEYVQSEVKKNTLNSKIVRSFGYGGFIHHFKNFILRKEQKYYTAALADINTTEALIHEYLSYNQNERIKLNLDVFLRTVQFYKKSLEDSANLARQGLTSNEIDQQVKIDDKPAIDALYALNVNMARTHVEIEKKADHLAQKQIYYTSVFFFIVAVFVLVTIFTLFHFFRLASKHYTDLASLFQAIPDAIIISDSSGNIIRFNTQAAEMFGYDNDEMNELTIEDLVPKSNRHSHLSNRENFQQHPKQIPMNDRSRSFSAERKNGELFDVKIAISTLNEDHELKNIAVVKDLSDINLLQKQAMTDQLTKLENRVKIQEILEDQTHYHARYGATFSVIMCDIDFFKSVNDTYGHPFGDKVLVNVAEILQNYSRITDHVSRWGGEEFLIVCPSTDLAGAFETAEKIRLKIQAAFKDEEMPLTASFGVAEYFVEMAVSELISNADKVLYQAKEQGRNTTVAYQVMKIL